MVDIVRGWLALDSDPVLRSAPLQKDLNQRDCVTHSVRDMLPNPLTKALVSLAPSDEDLYKVEYKLRSTSPHVIEGHESLLVDAARLISRVQ